MRKAFELKIYDQKSDEYIANYLNKNWYQKADWLPINAKRLWTVWKDAFYYWINIREKAKNLIFEGKVKNIFQAHSLVVELTTDKESRCK